LEGGLPLGINPIYLLAQLLNLVILFVVLYKFAFKRFLTMFDERSARINKGLEDAEIAGKRAAEAEEAYQERIEQAERERRAILAKATQEGEKNREEILTRAQEEAKQLALEAQANIERQREQATSELRKQVADLTLLATTRVIGQVLDEETHRRLIDEVLVEIGELE
jgi:F-type H+-transporting ATPase subunit b